MERIDARIVELARAQHGLVASRQLRALELDSRAIGRRVARGWLIERGDGVFQAGAVAGPRAPEMAALLRYGERSTISDGTAVVQWKLGAPGTAPVHVTVPTGVAGRPGVQVHRRVLADADRTTLDGLRITTPARTIADVSSSIHAVELQRLIEEAQLRNLASRAQLGAYAARRPALRKALEAGDEPQLTRSEAERRLLQLIRAAGLPTPRTNVRVAGHEVDMLWPAQRLVVEVDGYAFHGSRAARRRRSRS